MVTVTFPVFVGSHFYTVHPGCPFFRDEAVIQVKWMWLFPSEIEGGLQLFSVRFIVKVARAEG